MRKKCLFINKVLIQLCHEKFFDQLSFILQDFGFFELFGINEVIICLNVLFCSWKNNFKETRPDSSGPLLFIRYC